MKTVKKLITLTLLVSFIMSLFAACTPYNDQNSLYTISFDSRGGSLVNQINNIENGANITKPTDPTYLDYKFDGWYLDGGSFTVAWNWDSDIVDQNLTLHARWISADNNVESVENLLDEYGITLGFSGIWNDYMPTIYDVAPPSWWVKPSICTVQFISDESMPAMIISANIITDTTCLIGIPFYDQYGNEQYGVIYPDKYWVDFRPLTGFVVYGEYTMEIIVRIGNRQQAIIIQDEVFETH